MDVAVLLNDASLRRYRELLDSEDAAFDGLEHCYEDGDRAGSEVELIAWQDAVRRRLEFLSDRVPELFKEPAL